MLAIVCLAAVCRGGDVAEVPDLSQHVTGIASVRDIVTKYDHPLVYLESLKVKDTCKEEGGYFTSTWARYFEAGQMRWDSSSTFENQTRPE
jgi:hypothetical protein